MTSHKPWSVHLKQSSEIQHQITYIQQVRHDDGELTVYLDQAHNILNLIAKAGLDKPGTASKKTPYRSGHPVDSIEHQDVTLTY